MIFPAIGIERLRMGRDGDGVTTLVAAYGCPLRCKYCLNPQCFLPDFSPQSYTVEQLLEIVAIDDLYFQATDGGVIFGGGEPLLYADFIHEFRKAAPKEWKLSLETSLNVSTQQLDLVIEDIAYYLIDCKDMNTSIYEAYTGKTNELVLCNLELLSHRIQTGQLQPKQVCIRIPQIPDYNGEENRKESVEILQRMGFSCFDFFVYDAQYGAQKLHTKG